MRGKLGREWRAWIHAYKIELSRWRRQGTARVGRRAHTHKGSHPAEGLVTQTGPVGSAHCMVQGLWGPNTMKTLRV